MAAMCVCVCVRTYVCMYVGMHIRVYIYLPEPLCSATVRRKVTNFRNEAQEMQCHETLQTNL
jgi:hypothetical protein